MRITCCVFQQLYHEGVCMNLLEVVLFHGDSCEVLGEFSLDLLDYCYENATQLLSYKHVDSDGCESGEQDIKKNESRIQFDIGIRSISILRYFAEYADRFGPFKLNLKNSVNCTNILYRLPLSIISRMFKTLDVPLLFIELLNLKPWIIYTKNNQHTICTVYTGELYSI